MDHARVRKMANRHAHALERPSEERALVPQGVVFGGVDQRGGRATEIGAERRDARIVRREAVDAIELPIPRHRRFLDEIAAGQFASRSGAAERVQDRTEQQLQRELDARRSGPTRRRSREISSRRVAGDGQPAPIDGPARGSGGDGHDGRERILMRGRKTKFRGQSIVDRDDATSPEMTEFGAQRVAGFEIAGHQAAAVKEDQPREFDFREALRRVEAQRNCGFAVRQRVGAALDLGRGRRELRERCADMTQVRDLRRARSVTRRRVDEIEKTPCAWVQGQKSLRRRKALSRRACA